MRTVNTNVYQFNELNKDIQTRLIHECVEVLNEHIDMEFYEQDCIEQLQGKGFLNAKIYYNLSYGQGDGVAFQFDLCPEKKLEMVRQCCETAGIANYKKVDELFDIFCRLECVRIGNRHIAKNADISHELINYDLQDNIYDDVIERVLEALQSEYMELCETLKREGYAHIEDETSEERATEELEMHEYHACGTRYTGE